MERYKAGKFNQHILETSSHANGFLLTSSDPNFKERYFEGIILTPFCIFDDGLYFVHVLNGTEDILWKYERSRNDYIIMAKGARYRKLKNIDQSLYLLSDQDSEYFQICHFENEINSKTNVTFEIEDYLVHEKSLYACGEKDGIGHLLKNDQHLTLDGHSFKCFALKKNQIYITIESFNKEHLDIPINNISSIKPLQGFQFIDDTILPYFKFKGNDSKKAVIYLHGGPEDRVRPRVDRYLDLLKSFKCDIYAPNFIGGTGRGKTFEFADFELGKLQIISALENLIKKELSPYKDILVFGQSYGGYLAALSSTYIKQSISYIIVNAPISLKDYFNSTIPYRKLHRISKYGVNDQIDPVQRIPFKDNKYLFINGSNDNIVPPLSQKDGQQKFKINNQSNAIIIKNESHCISNQSFNLIYLEVKKFLGSVWN